MLHFKVSPYLYISISVDNQDSHLGLLQFTASIVLSLPKILFLILFLIFCLSLIPLSIIYFISLLLYLLYVLGLSGPYIH